MIVLNTLLAISKILDGNFHDELLNVDDNGHNPLHIAVAHHSINVCRGKISLLPVGYEKLSCEAESHRFFAKIFTKFVELLEIDKQGRLLEQAENKSGNSALQLAILAKQEEIAEEIAKRCTPDQINQRNFKGETSLHMAGFAGMGTGQQRNFYLVGIIDYRKLFLQHNFFRNL